MRTLFVLFVVCWSSIAFALGHRYAPQVRPSGTESQGYHVWMQQGTGLPGGAHIGPMQVVDSNIVWAGVWGMAQPAVIRTTNGGATWIRDTITIASANYFISGIYAPDAARCWVTMFDNVGTASGGLFRTTNGGATWTQDSTAFRTTGGAADFPHFFDASNGVCVGDPQNGYFEIYTTSNGGASWSRVPSGSIPAPLSQEYGNAFNFSAAGSSFWFPTYNDSGGTERYYRTTDKGLTWSVHAYSGASPGWLLTVGFQDDHVGLGNGGWGEISRTTDGGTNWTRFSSPAHLGFDDQIKYVPGTAGTYVGTGMWQYPTLQGGVIHGTAFTTDGGATWTGAGVEKWPTLLWLDFASVSAGWHADPSGPNICIWTIGRGRIIGTSMDSLNFVTLTAGQMSDTVSVDAVNFGSDSLTVLAIAAPGGQFAVVTQPALPARIPPLGSVRVGVRFAPRKNGVIQDSLVFVSNATNAPRATVYLQGSGTGATAVEPVSEAPKAFALSQNYPNPFNPATTISYSLPARAWVRLSVYNTLGQLVATLVNGEEEAGIHEVRFNGSNRASGIYFYRLQAGSDVRTRTLLLAK